MIVTAISLRPKNLLCLRMVVVSSCIQVVSEEFQFCFHHFWPWRNRMVTYKCSMRTAAILLSFHRWLYYRLIVANTWMATTLIFRLMVFRYHLRIEIILLSIFNEVCVVWGSVISGDITHWAYLCMVLIKVRERLRTRYPSIKITNRKEISYWITCKHWIVFRIEKRIHDDMFVLHAMRHDTKVASRPTFWCQVTAWVRGWLPVSGLGKLDIDTRILERRTRRTGMMIRMRLDIAKKTCPWQGDVGKSSRCRDPVEVFWNIF